MVVWRNLRYVSKDSDSCINKTWIDDLNIENACREYTQSWGKEVYYQWREAITGSTAPGGQGMCPDGWHIPTDEELKILEGTVDSQYGVETLIEIIRITVELM